MREEGAAGHVANRGVTSKADKIELAGEVSRLRSGLYIRDRPTDLPYFNAFALNDFLKSIIFFLSFYVKVDLLLSVYIILGGAGTTFLEAPVMRIAYMSLTM
ncbi:Uncharacterized protein Rs2_30812 [Raphanus sativus]|nr:Uncharacterized protein Rs2_30812 [Raphanus sativus]